MEAAVPAPVSKPMDVTMTAESAAPTADAQMPEMVEAVEPGEATKEAPELTASEPAPSEPAPSEPAPSEPAPSEPAPSKPAPSEPAAAEPASSEAPPAAVSTKGAAPSPSSRHPGPVKAVKAVMPGDGGFVMADDGNEADAEGAEEEGESEDDVYEVDCVLEQRPDPNNPGGREFLVKWKGWGHRCGIGAA